MEHLDRPREECGIFGTYGQEQAADITYLGLYSLQHRGQESSGITVSDGRRMRTHIGMGLVGDVFNEQILGQLTGSISLGHNRYSTTGRVGITNAQPIVVDCKVGRLAIAHNGNITNAVHLRDAMESKGHIFQSTSDSEIVLHRIARSDQDTLDKMIAEAVSGLEGSFSLMIMAKDKLFAYRDPLGFRPLCAGKLGDAWMLSSESCAFDIVKGRYIRDVLPGELITIDKNGLHSTMVRESSRRAHCVFEFVYFARPDSIVFNENVDKVRRKLGKQLASEQPVEADFVISVPDSSNSAALGYSLESGVRFEFGLIRNHYVGRTFISPKQSVRDSGVLLKFNPVRGVLNGKRVIVVDDSIVRGSTMRKLVKLLRDAGAREIHLRISSPAIAHPCYYGIDMPTREELIRNRFDEVGIAEYLGVDSLAYLSLEGMLGCVNDPEDFCTACFSGEYPVPVPAGITKNRMDRDL
ncbi:MAG: amidophosphoribosyltransferase [bacterium]|nr:amidophosphoribosyltransferase [bacterium]